MRGKRIAPAEMEILRYVIDHEPVTARQVADAMFERRGAARTTTITLLERLRTKSHLQRDTDRGVNLYRLGEGKGDLMKDLVGDFFETTLGGSLSPFVAFLTEKASLSEEEVAELTRMLQKAEDKS